MKVGTETPPLSVNMLLLRYWDYRLAAGGLLILLGLSAAIACFLLDRTSRQAYETGLEHAVVFDSKQPNGYSRVRLQYLTNSFAEQVEHKDNYYFGFDFLFRPYIISVRGGLTPEMKALVDYTYGEDSGEPPPPVYVYGYGERIETELLGYARDSYSQMWEGTRIPVTMEDLSVIIGDYYLDTVPRTYFEHVPWAALFYIVPAAVLAAGTVFALRYKRRLKAQKKRLAGCYEDLAAADLELADAKEYVKGSRVYLTPHFLVSGSYQFEILPYSCIKSLEDSGGFLIAVTKDGYAHIAAGGIKARSFSAGLKAELERRISENTEEKGDSYAAISGN